jgi:hypothetical protein
VYDIQNEYNLPLFENSNKKKFSLVDSDKFMKFSEKLRGFCFLIEECTGVMRGQVQKNFVQAVLSKRHTHNRFVLIFHSLHRIPPQIYEFCDYLVMFKTNDLEMNVKKKYPDIFNEWLQIQNAPRYSKKIYKKTNLSKSDII